MSFVAAERVGRLQEIGFDIVWLSHAEAIFKHDFGNALVELSEALSELTLPISEIVGSGGGETKFTPRLRRRLSDLGWPKHNFRIEKVIDGASRESTSHEVDHVRRFESPAAAIACEIEWNTKDTFYDRDLQNFKRLHTEGAISAGVIITRGRTLQSALEDSLRRFVSDRGIDSFDALARNGVVPTPKQRQAIEARTVRAREPIRFGEAWAQNFMSNKYGAATTHWDKLMERVARGVANPCPLLLIGLPATMIVHDLRGVEQLD